MKMFLIGSVLGFMLGMVFMFLMFLGLYAKTGEKLPDQRPTTNKAIQGRILADKMPKPKGN